MLKAETRRELDQIALVTTQPAAVERARDALIRTDAEERNNPAALLLKLKGLGPEFASLLWLESLFRSFGNRQVAAYGGFGAKPLAERRRRTGSGHLEVGQSPPAQDHDRACLVLVASPAGLGVEPLVSGASRRCEGTDPPDRHRRAGPQTPRRFVALCHPRRRSRGRRVQGGMTRWLNPIPAKLNMTVSPDPGGRRPRINPRAEAAVKKDGPANPRPMPSSMRDYGPSPQARPDVR